MGLGDHISTAVRCQNSGVSACVCGGEWSASRFISATPEALGERRQMRLIKEDPGQHKHSYLSRPFG
jgi:hypothetical protein